MSAFTDRASHSRALADELLERDPERVPDSLLPKIYHSAEAQVDCGEVSRPNAGRGEAGQSQKPVELGVNRVDVCRRVEHRIALGRVPSAAHAARPFAVERAVRWRVVAVNDTVE
jgi:hypothetical protein